MANEIRIRRNNISGTLSVGITNVATTLDSAAFVDLPTVDATSHMILVLDPLEIAGPAEIVRVTAHTAASAQVTVIRGVEGSSPRSHLLGTTWFHGPIASDTLEVVTSSTRPTIPYEGQLIYETDTDRYVSNLGAPGWRDAVPMGSWQTWAPVLSQGAVVASTTQHAQYTRLGKLVIAQFRVAAAAVGTAGQEVQVTIPVPALSTGSSRAVGHGWFIDVSVATYVGTWNVAGTGLYVSMISDASGTAGNPWGVLPNVAMATSDVMAGILIYEAA